MPLIQVREQLILFSGLSVNTTYTFVVTNSNNCTSPSSTGVTINSVPGAPVTGGPASVCFGNTANVTPPQMVVGLQGTTVLQQ
ncbi:MAG: hypothetical protein IPI53_11390 [Saprospiraceae bacterium]|nr:hypothetical protein [Saprospiraceae bacterium]